MGIKSTKRVSDLTDPGAGSVIAFHESSYQILFDSLADALHVVDRDMTILTFNKPFRDWNQKLGLPVDVAGKNLKQVFPFLPEQVSQEYERVFQTGEMLISRESVFLVGQQIHTETRKIPVIQDGRVSQIITLTRDITTTVQAEHRQRMDQVLLQSMMDAINESILLLDFNGVIEAINSTALRRFSLSGPVTGSSIYDVLPPDLSESRQQMLGQVFQSKLPATFQDQRDGRTMLHSLYPVLNENDQVSKVAIFSQDVTELRSHQEELKKAIAEKDLLLNELQHRVKNNLSVLISLLEMQMSSQLDNQAVQILKDFHSRIQAIALIYDHMASTRNLSEIEIGPYLTRLARNLVSAYDPVRTITLAVDTPNFFLEVNKALPCGLIVNELVTNSLKHAFPTSGHKTTPQITVRFETEGQNHRLIVMDNGIGLKEKLDPLHHKSLGLKLVRILATHQLGGSMDWTGENGTTMIITFPAETVAEDLT